MGRKEKEMSKADCDFVDEDELNSVTTIEFETYNEAVDFLADNNIDLEIPNGKLEHASYLVKKLIENGKRRVDIFSGSLKEELYESPEFLGTLKKFLFDDSSRRVRILFQDIQGDVKKRTLYKDLEDSRVLNQCLFYKASSNEVLNDMNHFVVNDSNGYRFEKDHEKTIATANFNDSKSAGILSALFCRYLKLSKPI